MAVQCQQDFAGLENTMRSMENSIRDFSTGILHEEFQQITNDLHGLQEFCAQQDNYLREQLTLLVGNQV